LPLFAVLGLLLVLLPAALTLSELVPSGKNSSYCAIRLNSRWVGRTWTCLPKLHIFMCIGVATRNEAGIRGKSAFLLANLTKIVPGHGNEGFSGEERTSGKRIA
jgi:hypothetical protein